MKGLRGGGDALGSQLNLSHGELERGVFVAPRREWRPLTAPLRPGPASARAGATSGFEPPFGWALVPALIVLGAGAAAMLALRRSWAPVAALLVGAVALSALLESGEDPAAQPARDALERDFVGLVSGDVFASDREYRERTLAKQADLGVGLLRQVFDWSRIERSPRRYSLRRYDDYVAHLAAHGVELLPILFNPPRFRSSAPRTGRRRGTYPPRRPRDMAAFAAALVRRYGPAGSLWRERPRLRRVPIRAWQVWNEPNLPVYWPRGPDAGEYARLLRATAAAIKRVDPHAEVVTAGLPNSRLGVPFSTFLRALYQAGGGEAFDTLAIHPYARTVPALMNAVAGVRNLIDRHGDGAGIWVTEIGWATAGPKSSFRVGEDRQARLISGALRKLAAARRGLGVRGVVYYAWRDAPPYDRGRDFWGLHTGLLDIGGRPKRGLRAFARAVARIR